MINLFEPQSQHSEFGRITVIRQVAYLAYHEQTHLPEIEALRSRFRLER